ncbi:hypothetical protein IWX91DRAFT_165925 [Phyllosticta citricarpa]
MLCCVVVVVVDVRRLLLCHFIITYLSLVSSSFSGLRETPSFLPSLLPCRVLPPSDTAECHRPKSQPTHQPTNPPTIQPTIHPSIHPFIQHPSSNIFGPPINITSSSLICHGPILCAPCPTTLANLARLMSLLLSLA